MPRPATPPLHEIELLSKTREYPRSKFHPAKELKYTVSFTNETDRKLSLLWKDYSRKAIKASENLKPGHSVTVETYLTHPFEARHFDCWKMRMFVSGSTKSTVFQGLKFGAVPNSTMDVRIRRTDNSPEKGLSNYQFG